MIVFQDFGKMSKWWFQNCCNTFINSAEINKVPTM